MPIAPSEIYRNRLVINIEVARRTTERRSRANIVGALLVVRANKKANIAANKFVRDNNRSERTTGVCEKNRRKQRAFKMNVLGGMAIPWILLFATPLLKGVGE